MEQSFKQSDLQMFLLADFPEQFSTTKLSKYS